MYTNSGSTADSRYDCIAPIVCRQGLSRGEQAVLLRQISKERGIAIRTLERYIKAYRKGGRDALEPESRVRKTLIPQEHLKKTEDLRKENPYRTIETIISMLEASGSVPAGVLKKTTVYEHLKRKGLDRKSFPAHPENYRKFGAQRRGEIFQGDVHHSLKIELPTPDGGRHFTTKLFLWLDDFTRNALHGQFYPNEKMPALEDSLKKALIKFGVPEIIYVDNAAIYSSHHMAKICAKLGIRLVHSRPYKPQGRGKIEKIFQLVDTSFRTEAELLIKDGIIKTLDDLNRYFFIWVDKFYNNRIHASTKQRPSDMWDNSQHPVKKKTLSEIKDAFLVEDTAKVSQTGIIKLESNEYEVESCLSKKSITILYDPYDLTSGIQVFYEGTRYADAVPAIVRRHHKKDYSPDVLPDAPRTGLNHLEILKNNASSGMKYSDLKEESL